MFCTKCGTNVIEGQSFCPNCGENLKSQTIQSNPSSPIQDTINEQPTPEENMPVPVGFILSLVSIIAWLLPLVGYPVTICGIIFSARHIRHKNKTAKTLGIIGLVLSILFLLLTLGNSILGVIIALATM